jgi:hypothetical protein
MPVQSGRPAPRTRRSGAGCPSARATQVGHCGREDGDHDRLLEERDRQREGSRPADGVPGPAGAREQDGLGGDPGQACLQRQQVDGGCPPGEGRHGQRREQEEHQRDQHRRTVPEQEPEQPQDRQ